MPGAQAWINAHKPQAAAGALAGLAGLVYLVKRRKAASGGSTASPFALPALGGGTVGTTPYDSTANDVYNGVQPLLEGLQNQVDRLSTINPGTQALPVTTPPDQTLPGAPAAGGAPAAPIVGNPPATTGSVTAQQAQALWPTSTQQVNLPVTLPLNTGVVDGSWINYSYIGVDGKQYQEKLPNTAGNQKVLAAQGVKLS